MKTLNIILVTLFIFNSTFAQTSESDKVLGIWTSEAKDGKIEVFKLNNKYYAKLLWGKTVFDKDGKTPLNDDKNPDPKLRSRSRLNIIFINDLVYSNGEYAGGKLYDINSGRTYSVKMKLINIDKLEMRGYLGISLLGKSGYWLRVKK